ncbi:MAG: hypothetical protein QNJ07_05195 [Woeseiaceae bacterium]|nr:hypothetical protein [Woeseiaceae bacterium]
MFELVREHWALVAASVLLTALVLQAIFAAVGRSAGAHLRRGLQELEQKRRAARAARRRADRARRRCARLEAKAASVRPIRLEEARAALSDSEALLKIAHDQVLVAENQVRRVIVEQFPPAKQEKLRARHKVSAAPSDKPFTFQG